jgi:uncharacterized membrane protein
VKKILKWKTSYFRIEKMSSPTHLLKISRLEGLTDGIFAIAMTILVLDLRLPESAGTGDLLDILKNDVLLKLFIYAGSFVILGTLWVAMNFQLGLLERLNRQYLWTNVFYLMVICVVPFSASLIGSYPNSPTSISFYAINLLCASLGQLLTAQCSHTYNLNKEIYTPAIRHAVIRRIFVAPIFYIGSLVVAHWNTTAAAIMLVAPTVLYMIPGSVDRYESGG